jgi:hypothetical protein
MLSDGGLNKPNQVVSNGSITMAADSFFTVVGLPYTQKVKTLVQEAGTKSGTAQGKIQKISQIGFKVNRSHKGFLVGGSTTMLERINFRDPTTLMGTPEALYTGVIPNVTFRDDYRYGSQVLIYNPDPLPLEILSIMTEIDTNE